MTRGFPSAAGLVYDKTYGRPDVRTPAGHGRVLVSVIPMIILLILAQHHFERGTAMTGIKR